MASLPTLPRLERHQRLILLSAAISVWAGIAGGWPGPRLGVWERQLEQQLILLRGPRRPPGRVVVVPVDDASLQQAAWFKQGGRNTVVPPWARNLDTLPWPRQAYGRLSHNLLEAGASAVALNVVFEGQSGKGAADDTALNALLHQQRGHVALAAEMLEPEDSRGAGGLTLVLPETFLAAIGGDGATGLTNSLPPLPGQAMAHPEAYSGRVLAAQGVKAPPSLSTTLLKQAGLRSQQPDARMALNMYGPEGSFTRLPAWEVLDPQRWRNHPLKPALRGALVVVGPLEGGRQDTVYGPMSGLELLATATANSLQGDGLLNWPEPPLARALLSGATVLLAASAALALRRRSLRWRLAVVGAALALQLAAGVLAFQGPHRWIPLLAPASGLMLLGLLYGGDAYLVEGQERKRLRRTFERYVAPSVVAEILSDPKAAQSMLRGRVLEVTVLFSDLQGFTQLTRRRSAHGESELHVRQLNMYLGAMVEVITAHGGTVDKFIGDCVMAVFGSPVGRGLKQEAEAAVRCAIAMGEKLRELNATWLQQQQDGGESLEQLGSGVGLASGEVMAGQIGSPQRSDFTVIGDTVNLASRLEGLTRRLETSICLDGATADLISHCADLKLHSYGFQDVKGLEPTEVFSVQQAIQDNRSGQQPA